MTKFVNFNLILNGVIETQQQEKQIAATSVRIFIESMITHYDETRMGLAMSYKAFSVSAPSVWNSL